MTNSTAISRTLSLEVWTATSLTCHASAVNKFRAYNSCMPRNPISDPITISKQPISSSELQPLCSTQYNRRYMAARDTAFLAPLQDLHSTELLLSLTWQPFRRILLPSIHRARTDLVSCRLKIAEPLTLHERRRWPTADWGWMWLVLCARAPFTVQCIRPSVMVELGWSGGDVHRVSY